MSILIRSIIGRKAFSAERKGNWSKHYHKLRANWHLWTKRNFCQQKKERKDKTWLEQTLQKLWQHQHTFLLILWITSTHAFPKMLFLINPNWVNIGYRGNLLPFFETGCYWDLKQSFEWKKMQICKRNLQFYTTFRMRH